LYYQSTQQKDSSVLDNCTSFFQGRVWPQMASTILLPSQTLLASGIVMPSYGTTFTCTLYSFSVLSKYNLSHNTLWYILIRISYYEFCHGSSCGTEQVINHAFFWAWSKAAWPFFCPTNIKEILKTHSGLVSHSLN